MASGIDAGTPQGSPLSLLLANIALDLLDQGWTRAGQRLGTLVRYADDLVVLCRTRSRAEEARALTGAVLGRLGLRMHPDKTKIVCLSRGKQGLDFLGFHHRMKESAKWRGRWYLQKWPGQRAMRSIRAKVRAGTDRRFAWARMEDIATNLNPVLRGWGAYFRHGNSWRKFAAIDSYVNQRIAMLASVKHGRRGWGWGARFDYTWANNLGIHRLTGSVRYWDANA